MPATQESVTHTLEVRGEFACFSRPELKVERWSYPCPTPSAARGIFDSIFAKPPEFRWQIERIELLMAPSYCALRRNEVSEVVRVSNVKKWMKGSAEPAPLMADDSKNRQQRQTMALRNVKYRIHAHIAPWPGFEGHQKALDEQFRRRASRGKCFCQPSLGCREFVAFFRLIEDVNAERTQSPPIELDQEIGWMVYDVFDLSKPGTSDSGQSISLFRAEIRHGVVEVPDFDSDDVRRPERRAG